MSKYVPVTAVNTSIEVEATRVEIEIAEKLARSIRLHPRKWKHEEYCLIGPGPIIFWAANGQESFKQYFSEYRAKSQPVVLSPEVCRKVIWPAYVEWRLQINAGFLNSGRRIARFRSWMNSLCRKPVALLEYKPERRLD